MSTGELTLNIATLGSSAVAKLQKARNRITNNPVVKTATKVDDVRGKAQTRYESVEQLFDAQTEADYVCLAAVIASILDPTHVSPNPTHLRARLSTWQISF